MIDMTKKERRALCDLVLELAELPCMGPGPTRINDGKRDFDVACNCVCCRIERACGEYLDVAGMS